MQRDMLAPALIGALVLAAIIAGLSVTGGPNSARAEKRDTARLNDLRDIIQFVQCRKALDDTLPDALTAVESCSDPAKLADPTSAQPYSYERLSENSYRLCADFERPELIEDFDLGPGRWNAESGCFTLTEK